MLSKLVPSYGLKRLKDSVQAFRFLTVVNIEKKKRIVTDTERGSFCPVEGTTYFIEILEIFIILAKFMSL
jgi:hypothetical protein